LETSESSAEKRKAKELKEDLMRLKRVEQLYVNTVFAEFVSTLTEVKQQQNAVLPVLSGWVLVLLKLLLATVSASTNVQVPQSSTSSVFPPAAIPSTLIFIIIH